MLPEIAYQSGGLENPMIRRLSAKSSKAARRRRERARRLPALGGGGYDFPNLTYGKRPLVIEPRTAPQLEA
jgi:hypothetical protein